MSVEKNVRKYNRDLSLDPGDVEAAALEMAEELRRGHYEHGYIEVAAILGDARANMLMSVEKESNPMNTEEWLELLGDTGGLSVRAVIARSILRAIREDEGVVSGELQEISEDWREPLTLFNEYIENPTEEAAKKFVISADATFGGVPKDTVSGIPTLGSVSAYMLLLHDLLYQELEPESDHHGMNPKDALRYMYELSTNDEYGAGLSDEVIREFVTKDLMDYTLKKREA